MNLQFGQDFIGMAHLCSLQFHQLAAGESTLCCLTCKAGKLILDGRWNVSQGRGSVTSGSLHGGDLGFYSGFLTTGWANSKVNHRRRARRHFPYLILEVTWCCFNHPLFIKAITKSLQFQGRGHRPIAQGREIIRGSQIVRSQKIWF